tara:strand:+ start:105 stop:617 length:513 start_codon:yes stop_codon:yes gene_type:complete
MSNWFKLPIDQVDENWKHKLIKKLKNPPNPTVIRVVYDDGDKRYYLEEMFDSLKDADIFISNISVEDESHRKHYTVNMRESAFHHAVQNIQHLVSLMTQHGADEKIIAESIREVFDDAERFDNLTAEEQDAERLFNESLIPPINLEDFLKLDEEEQIKIAMGIKEKSTLN